MRGALTLFCLQAIFYAVVSLNTIAIASRDYLPTAITACLVSLLSWIAVTEIVQPGRKTLKVAGYVLGSVIGDLAGIWIAGLF